MLENKFHPVDCVYVERNLIQYHEKTLSAPSIKAVRGHIETCDSCAQSLSEYRQLEGMLFADAVHYRQPVTFSAEVERRIRHNVYIRVRWRILGRFGKREKRPISFHPAYGLAAVLLLFLGLMGYRNAQLSHQYTVLETQHTALVSEHEVLFADYTELNQNLRKMSERVAKIADDTLDVAEDTLILQDDLDKLLLVAVANSDVSDVRAFLHSGANIETADSRGRTPLIYAIDRRNRRMIDMLLDQGADIDAKTTTEGTPLYRAYQVAKQYEDSSFFEWLLDAGADLNAPTIGETTMWSILLSNGDSELVEIVLEKKSDLDRFALYDRTPLMLAAANGHKEVVSTLLAAGADKQRTTEDGKTAAEIAWDAGHWETAIILHNAQPISELEFDHPRIQQFVTIPKPITDVTFDDSGMQQLAMVFSHPDVIRARQQQ